MIKVGIFFGGKSREREVSFAGGRTVYDNLDKRLFKAIPIFVDALGNLVELDWPFVYRGTIRDFYPPVTFVPPSKYNFQVYADSLTLSNSEILESLKLIGKPIQIEELKNKIDLAFLALHGAGGEDGSIQGMLEWLAIPYTGSSILPSAIGMNKGVQKVFQSAAFDVPAFTRIKKDDWQNQSNDFFSDVLQNVGFPCVVKPANQGSSIGVSVLKKENKDEFNKAIDLAFFKVYLDKSTWESADKVQYVRQLADVRDGLGMPLLLNNQMIFHPDELLDTISNLFETENNLILEAALTETEVLIESFINGKEFSCIVIQDDNGKPIALPPTEIVKGKELFDYRSKYLPGLSRKITPIELPNLEISKIRKACENLYSYFCFDVYARIDGFYDESGKIILNDPNTTSGMMPSSFFFHQAAEIGLNPSQFLTFIIRNSLQARFKQGIATYNSKALLLQLDSQLSEFKSLEDNRTAVAVIMGGYSTERHISVESGRNIYEKLSSSSKYRPIPVFLTGNNKEQQLYILPVNVMLKDNADDIKNKVEHFSRAKIIEEIIDECKAITEKYAPFIVGFEPQRIDYKDLPGICQSVFIALHGRPGEDGALQQQLEKLNLPYNGSGIQSSQITINKFETNKILRQNGVLVADGELITKADWINNHNSKIAEIETMGFPFIAKPADEGCSSAVLKLKTFGAIESYANLTFRDHDVKDPLLCDNLGINAKDEFPMKDDFLLEKFIDRAGAKHFLEVTGGMLTYYDSQGQLQYQIFEASESLAEGEILSLAEKFLAGEGQNITPARYSINKQEAELISAKVKILNVQGYCRIDAFVRVYDDLRVEVVIIEINSLPGMTPATCIYHQAAIEGYKPLEFIDKILTFGMERNNQQIKS
jgi:UDP-N-acetylmuramate--alanine ligase